MPATAYHEYATQTDDGRDLKSLKDADVILLGLSGTGKTFVSLFLAEAGLYAANIPLVPSLKEIAPQSINLSAMIKCRKPLVIGFNCDTNLLVLQRKIAGKSGPNALDHMTVRQECIAARNFYNEIGCIQINVTNKSPLAIVAEIKDCLSRQCASRPTQNCPTLNKANEP